jgi:AcrR family transcriptional regulator
MSTAAPPRTRNKERTKARLLEAAVAEFGRLGFEDIKIDGVAESVGLNKKLVYYYFDDKEGLFEAANTQVMSNIHLWADNSGLERMELNGLLLCALDFFAAHPKLTRFLVSNWERIAERQGLSGCGLYERFATQMMSKGDSPMKLLPSSLLLATLQLSTMEFLARSENEFANRPIRLRLAALFMGSLYDCLHLPSRH